jgi:RNA polymerase sigma-70 factor (ECF subfamily)
LPEAIVESRETLALAFVAAMQLLPAKQRVVLVLREVLGWSAKEAADLLGESAAAVNSALQRARARLETERAQGTLAREHLPVSGEAEATVMRRFQEAWDAVDIPGIMALLERDALLTMPPEGARIEGADAIASFFATEPLDGLLDRIKLVLMHANGQPGFAAYAQEESGGAYRAYGVMVFAIIGERIVGITGFPERPELFTRLGLSTELDN